MIRAIIILITIVFYSCSGSASLPVSVLSPNGESEFIINADTSGKVSYSLRYNDKDIISNSLLGYVEYSAELTKVEKIKRDSVWMPVWGKRKSVEDKYNGMILTFRDKLNHSNVFTLEVRAYTDGVAFRYGFPQLADSLTVTEQTRYDFTRDNTAWYYNGEYPNLGPEKLSECDTVRRPIVTIKVDDSCYLALHEADLMCGDPLLLQSKKDETAFSIVPAEQNVKPGYVSAWRVIMTSKTPGGLVDSHLIELLNPDPETDMSWVKPGVAVWDWRIDGAKVDGFNYGMNYESWVRMIDFAAEQGFRYLVLDANWYGPEHDSTSDPINGDKAKDARNIIAYGKSKDIGVWLYLNDVGGREYPIEETLKQYGDWGAAGVKYGFMKGSASDKNLWTKKITALCAENKLLVDFHDNPIHPYGQMRTYPNAVTREYCHAQLDAHRVFVPSTFVTTVFVNMVAGPIDMNNGMFDLRQGKTTRVDENMPVPSTVVSEAARTLIVFSGATILPDIPEYYKRYPTLLQFIAAQKMPWQESRTIAGEIGEYIVMARQADDGAWLIAAATNEQSRKLSIPLAVLGAGRYKAVITQDGDKAHYLTNRETFAVSERVVTGSDSIEVMLAPGGGACIELRKIP